MQVSDFIGIVIVAVLALSAAVGKVGFDMGYNEARADLAKPIEYRCVEGQVYKSNTAFLIATSQKCRPLEGK
jgi:hypothetical protein